MTKPNSSATAPPGVDDSAWDPYDSQCPSRAVWNRLGDKWALLVICLLSSDPLRFNELRRRIDGVSQKMLSQTLKNLERDGLVHRQVHATVPVTVEYSITELGASLSEIIRMLRQWTALHMPQIQVRQKTYDQKLARYHNRTTG